MYLRSIANAVPSVSFTQQEAWASILNNKDALNLTERSYTLLEKVLLGDSGIETRHFALDDMGALFRHDAETLNLQFERHAPRLALTAFNEALDKAFLQARDIGALIICTCTGYLCPGISSYVAEFAGCRSNVYMQDLVGLGCGAAIPTLRAVEALTLSQPKVNVAMIAVEICSAAYYLDNDPGVLISACLFGDGASASIWSGEASSNQQIKMGKFDTVHRPENRELIRFVNAGGKLKNKLHRTVPEKAAEAVHHLYQNYLSHSAKPDVILSHTGGRDVLTAIRERLPDYPLAESFDVLKRFGNMSSPSVMFALEKYLTNYPNTSAKLWLTSFGAGFSAHSCELDIQC